MPYRLGNPCASRRSRFNILGCALVLCLSSVASSFGQVPVTTVAREGGAAPGTPAGTVFDTFAIPRINDAGAVLFSATLTGPGVTASNNNGIWAGDPGSLALVAREGEPAPGLASGLSFDNLQGAALNPSGEVAFESTIAGVGVTTANDEAFWAGPPGGLQLAVREGDPAPGTPPGVVFGTLFGPPVIGPAGEVAFFAQLSGPGVTSSNDQGLWVGTPGSLLLVAREGDPAPGGPPGSVYSFTSTRSISVNSSGDIAYLVNIFGGGASGRGIWTGPPASPTLAVRKGDPAPGTPPGTVFNGLRPALLEDGGKIAFGSFLSGPGVVPSNNRGLWAGPPGALQLVIREGDSAPGASGGETITLGNFPGINSFNSAGNVTTAQGARFAGAGVTSANDEAVWFGPPGSLALMAREGDPAPGIGGGATLVDLRRRGANESDQVLYQSNLTGGGTSPGDNGLWLASNGVPDLLIRSGDTVEISPGEIVTLGVLRLVTQASLNDSGQVVFGAGIPQSSEEAIFIISPGGPPVADAGSDQSVDEGDLVTLDGSGSMDPQGDPLSYTWSQLAGPPVILDLADPVHPTFSAPPVSANITLTLRLVVDDGLDSSEADTVDVTVVSVNNPPVADAGDDGTIKEGATAQLDGASSFDPEGDPIGYTWAQVGGPAVALVPGGNVAQPTFVAPLGIGQVLTFKLIVDDGFEASDPSPGVDSSFDDTVAVTLVENSAPVADAGPDQTKDEGALVTLAGSGNDPDLGDGLSFQWTQTAGPIVLLDDGGSSSPSFVAPAVSPGGDSVTFSLVVTDDDPVNPRSSAPDEVVISIRNINDPPSCALAVVDPTTLWPPNHKLRAVAIEGLSDPDSVYDDLEVTIVSVTQDEPIEGTGDGDSSPDAVVQPSDPINGVLIRAERSGSGDGRVYEVAFLASDGFESCSGSVRVVVPKSRKKTAIDSGQNYDSTLP